MLSSTSLGRKIMLEKLITDNSTDNTGFLMCISSCCISCIFQNNIKKAKYFLAEFSSDVNAFQYITGIDSLSQMFLEIAQRQAKDDVKYYIKFLCCSTNLSNEVKQRIMAKTSV